MPGARCTRGLACNGDGRGAHEHTGEAESIRHSLRNGFTAYNVISPVSLALLPPSTPTSGRQDHTTSPYASVPFAFRHFRVHRNPSQRPKRSRYAPRGEDEMTGM
jgi:hypothetical protein